MEKIFEKITAYDFLNSFIPGAIYVVLADRITRFSILSDDIFTNTVTIFFAGLVIGRIGSLIIEPLFRHIRINGKPFLNYSSYSDYVEAEKIDDTGIIRNLSTINNMYRSISTAMMCLLFTILVSDLWDVFLLDKLSWIILGTVFVLLVIFLFSYKKQTKYIKSRVDKTLQLRDKDISKDLKDDGALDIKEQLRK